MNMVRTKPGEVAKLREELRIKQTALAERARVDPKTLRAIERGDRPVSEVLVQAVARELGVSVASLLDEHLSEGLDEMSRSIVRLRQIDGPRLFKEITSVGGVRWHLGIRPTPEQMPRLALLEAYVEQIRVAMEKANDGTLKSQLALVGFEDALDTWIHSLANERINLLAGTYFYWDCDTSAYEGRRTVSYISVRTLLIALVPATQSVIELQPDMGDIPPDYAPDSYHCYLRDGRSMLTEADANEYGDLVDEGQL